jgi:hypothetical protein
LRRSAGESCRPDKAELLAEARKRGLVPGEAQAAEPTAQPIAEPAAQQADAAARTHATCCAGRFRDTHSAHGHASIWHERAAAGSAATGSGCARTDVSANVQPASNHRSRRSWRGHSRRCARCNRRGVGRRSRWPSWRGDWRGHDGRRARGA